MHRKLDDLGNDVLIHRDYVEREARYHGMRLTADEYYALEDDGCKYELIDGVVCMTPSPMRRHGLVSSVIARRLGDYVEKHSLGEVAHEMDVHLGKGQHGGDLVLRPDIMFFKAGRIPQDAEKYEIAPDVVVEVASISTRQYDRETKKADYQRVGVSEYWIIDPQRNSMTFYRLQEGRFVEVTPEDELFSSAAVPGFVLNLAEIKKAFRPA